MIRHDQVTPPAAVITFVAVTTFVVVTPMTNARASPITWYSLKT